MNTELLSKLTNKAPLSSNELGAITRETLALLLSRQHISMLLVELACVARETYDARGARLD